MGSPNPENACEGPTPTESCPPGKCEYGMCSGLYSHFGPCGGCCGCLGGCLIESENRVIAEQREQTTW